MYMIDCVEKKKNKRKVVLFFSFVNVCLKLM